MNTLFEYTDKLSAPYECFILDANPENFPIHPHWHYFMEIMYMIEGTAMVNCGEQSFVVEQGDMVVFLPHEIHSVYAVASIPLKYYVLKFDPGQLNLATGISGGELTGLHFSSVFRAAKGNVQAPVCLRAEEINGFEFERIFAVAHGELQEQDYGYGVMIQTVIIKILVCVLRCWRKNGFDTDQSFKLHEEEESIYSITEYIDGHIQENLRVEELAKLCHMSYSHFAKLFREMYGQSCKKYIEFVRLCKAEELLRFTNLDLNYISQETGFADCSHFIKAFKGKHGITPHKYRSRQ